MKDVVVYSTNYCPYCRYAERLLTELGVAFQDIDVTGNREMRQKLVALSGGRRTVPQIFVGGTPIGGYTDMAALHRAGRLLPLIHDY